jgi:hypothetical protein
MLITRIARVLPAVIAVLVVSVPVAADAQVWVGKPKPQRGSVEISGGGTWTSGQSLPQSSATLTVNPSGGSSSFEQFDSEATMDPAFGVHGAVAVYITRALAIEGGVQFSRPRLDIRLTNDFEDAPDVTATSTISSYLFTGSLIYHFGAATNKMVPYIAGGAGHLRDVHSGNELVETGTEYHGKAGVKMWFGRTRAFGLRLEGGISVRDGGFSLEDERRYAPTAAASLVYLY